MAPGLDLSGIVLSDRLGGPELPAIGAVARVYRGRGRIERAELMQEGVVGLLRALER